MFDDDAAARSPDQWRFRQARRKFLQRPADRRRFRHQNGDAHHRGLSMKRLGGLAALVLATGPAFAQFAKNPFSLGVDEGAVGHVGRLGLWLLQEQARFYQALRHAVEAAQSDPKAGLTLAAVAFAYGVFHAAGPGHGKAVIASYMLANERALKRGIVLALLAAMLQAVVAVALVAVAALGF